MIQNFNISVVIPTYNRVHTISRALNSVINQTLTAFEIIVVDDGSNDQTKRLIEDNFANVKLIQQSNHGVSHARNQGIAAAAGNWVAFLDSDDEWHKNKLAIQADVVIENPDYKICHCDEIWIRNGRQVNPKKKHAKRGGWIFNECLPLCAISPSAALIHRSLFKETGDFDESLPACEDYDLWLRITSRYPVLYTSEKLLNKYGGHADQLSLKHWGMDRFRIQALEKILAADHLDTQQRVATLHMLNTKLEILLLGAEKHNNTEIISCYRKKHYHYHKQLQQTIGLTTS